MKENNKCYISDEPLDNSMEHIIPNAIGGHLKSNKLVCHNVNNKIFKPFDDALTEHLSVFDSRQYKRDDGKKKGTVFKDENGRLIKISNNETIPLGAKPIYDEEGRVKAIPANQLDSYIISQKKKNPEFNEHDFRGKIIKAKEDKKILVYPTRGSFYSFDNIFKFKGIVKIATNFAINNNCDKKYIKGAIDFLCNNDSKGNFFTYITDLTMIKYKYEESEVSHILHFKGCSKLKKLYCYIELFNLHQMVVVLNDNYEGTDIEPSNYIWNLDLGERIDRTKDFQMEFTDSFDKVEFQVLYERNLERLNNLWGLNIKKVN